jgi:hypothetical protein
MPPFLVQFLGSAVAIAAVVGLAAWAKISRDAPPLDDAHARRVLAEEFPDAAPDAVWTDADGSVALARAGDALLTLHRAGDGYAANTLPISALTRARREGERVVLALGPGARPLRFAAGDRWPPFG